MENNKDTPNVELGLVKLQDALKDPSVPKLYVNGFAIGSSDMDFVILMNQNNQPLQLINMSFTTFKTFCQKAVEACDKFEKNTGITIHTIDEVKNKKQLKKESKK